MVWIRRVFTVCIKHKIIEFTMFLFFVREVKGAVAGSNRLPSASFMVYFRDYFVDHAMESR